MTIKIKTDESGNIRKVRTNGDIHIATKAVKLAADKPRRYAMKRTRASRFILRLKKLKSRIGYIFTQTARAFKLAFSREFSREDIPRHQS